MTDRTELTGLTALRAFAALFVMMFHTIWFSPHVSFEVLLWVLFSSGWFGVDVFFVLSGFVISYIYSTDLRYGEYLWRRMARIYPLLFVTTLAAWFFINLFGKLPFMTLGNFDILMNFLMLQAWYTGFEGSVNFVSWSVSAEWAAYMLFPLLLYLSRAVPANWLGALIPVGVLATVGGLAPLGLSGPVNKCLFQFLSGIVLYRFWVRKGSFGSQLGYWALLSVVCVISAPTAFHHFGIPFSDYYLAICAVPIVAYAVGKPTQNRLLLLAGRASYSLYLMHGLVYLVLRRMIELDFMSRGPAFILMPLLSLTLALATYYTIEKPARYWIVARLRAAGT